MPCVARASTGTFMAAGSVMPTISAASMTAVLPFGSLDDSVRRVARASARAGNLRDETIAAARQHGVERSFAAVGHRTRANLGRGPYAREAASRSPPTLRARRASL